MRALVLTLAVTTVAACGGGAGDDDGTGTVDAAGGADSASVTPDAAAPIADASPPADAASYDPTGGIDTPGEHGGAGCPDSEVTEFTVSVDGATSRVFAGTVTGADGNGQFYVKGAGNQELFGTIPTNVEGSYSVNVPIFCGSQLVKLMWTNATCPYVIVYDVTAINCVDPDLRITLLWDELGADWELHLIKEGGRINDNATDCTWTSCIGVSPDWGVPGDPADDPHKDVDNTGAYGPENIWLAGPESGTYTVMVEHWSSSGDPSSDGTVIFNAAGQPITVVSIENLAPHWVWTAGTITFPGGTVNPGVDTYDCTATWSSGCTADIP